MAHAFSPRAAGTLTRVFVMIPANFVILNLQFELAPGRVAALLWPVIIPLNALASAINTLLSAGRKRSSISSTGRLRVICSRGS